MCLSRVPNYNVNVFFHGYIYQHTQNFYLANHSNLENLSRDIANIIYNFLESALKSSAYFKTDPLISNLFSYFSLCNQMY